MNEEGGMQQRNARVAELWIRLVETARLMVGVGDYQRYVAHMETAHPGQAPMSEAEYFRFCQESRYPGKDGAIKRCPC